MHTPRIRRASPAPQVAAALCFFTLVGLARASDDSPAIATPPPENAAPTTPADAKPNAIENAVVKVFSTVRRPDVFKPWTKSAPVEISGSGVIIEGKRILTNAHVVLYASQVQVQANQSGDKISATIEAIAPGIDLAVLKLEDESLFDTRPPIARANTVPDIKEPVMAYGYPRGGNSLSITKGIVSRIEFAPYAQSTSGLRIQVDAAINPGNSGGPAIVGDRMIGIAFSNLSGAQNIGYIIPTEEVNLFLADVSDGKYDGKPAMFDELQTMQNPALLTYLGLPKDVNGVIVHEPDSTEPGYPLKKWDVITKIGDTPIDDEGMVKVGTNLRVRFPYLIQKIAREGKVGLTILRSGKEIKIELPVRSERGFLIDNLSNTYPPYFVFGPMVFSTATGEFVESAGSGTGYRVFSILASPMVTRRSDKPAFEGEELVVVSSPFFPHKLSKGYQSPIGRVVESIDGRHVNNLKHLVELLRDAKGDHVTIEFAGRGVESIVLPRKECIDATEDILTDNGVRAQGSADTLAVWNARPAAAAAAKGSDKPAGSAAKPRS